MDDPPTQNGDEAAPATAAHSADFTGTTTPARTAAPAEAAAPAETPSPAQATEAAIPPHSDGVLYPSRLPAFHRVPATGDIAAFVRWFWISEWDIGPRRTSRQHIIGYPASNLVVSNDRTEFSGPTTRASHRDLSGSGWAVGALLQPAAIPLVLNRVDLDGEDAGVPGHMLRPGAPACDANTGGSTSEVSPGDPACDAYPSRPTREVSTRGPTRESTPSHQSTPGHQPSPGNQGADASSGDISFLGVQAASATAGVCRASSNTTGVIRPSPSCFLLR